MIDGGEFEVKINQTLDTSQINESHIHTLSQSASQVKNEAISTMPNVKVSRKKKLLTRSHHTINTIKGPTQRHKNGYKIESYKSFIFGGLI